MIFYYSELLLQLSAIRQKPKTTLTNRKANRNPMKQSKLKDETCQGESQ